MATFDLAGAIEGEFLVLKIRIKQPGRDDRTLLVQGNEALIGRGKECDVVVSDRHVSGRHAKVLSGVVVIDLESTNGTFVAGQRVRDAAVLKDGTFRLGADDEDVRIEITQEEGEDIGATLMSGVEPETETSSTPDEEAEPDLEKSVPRQSDPREATLSQNRELRGRVKKLEAKLAKYAESVAIPFKQKIKELEAKRAMLERAVKALRAQLAEKEEPAESDGPATAVVSELQFEIDRLREEVKESKRAASQVAPLQSEVRRLEGQLEAARANGTDDELEDENARLKAALNSTREKLSAALPAEPNGAKERIRELERLLAERTAQVQALEVRLAEAEGHTKT